MRDSNIGGMQGTAAAGEQPGDIDRTTPPRGDSKRRTKHVTAGRPRTSSIRSDGRAIGAAGAGSDDPWVADPGAGDECLVTSKQVRARIGGVSSMCVWRWVRDGKFPAPVPINGRNYWRAGVIRAWITAQGAAVPDCGNEADHGSPAAATATGHQGREYSK